MYLSELLGDYRRYSEVISLPSPRSPLFISLLYLCAVSAAELALDNILEFACNHILAQRRDMVYKHLALQVVKLMLHDAGQIAVHPLVVGLQFFVKVGDMYARGAHHLFGDTRNGEAALFRCLLLTLFVHL